MNFDTLFSSSKIGLAVGRLQQNNSMPKGLMPLKWFYLVQALLIALEIQTFICTFNPQTFNLIGF